MSDNQNELKLSVKLTVSDGQVLEFPAGTKLTTRKDMTIKPTAKGEVAWALELCDQAGRIWGRPFTLLVDGELLVEDDQVLSAVILHESGFLLLDCIVEEREEGYRFDPTSLEPKPTQGRPNLDAGLSLFERGFAQPGTITPGNIRMITLCGGCSEEFKFRTYHAGFSDIFYYYCDSCPNVVSVSHNEDLVYEKMKKINKVITPPARYDDFTTDEVAENVDLHNEITSLLRPCPCGGSFALFNPPTCPHCGTPYIDFREDIFRKINEYYLMHVQGAESLHSHWVE